MSITVLIEASHIQRYGLSKFYQMASAKSNCSFCVCNTPSMVPDAEHVFACDPVKRAAIEAGRPGIDCGKGEVHVYRQIGADFELIPFDEKVREAA